MTLPDVDLVHRQPLQILEFRPTELPLESSLLNVIGQVPRNAQLTRHILRRHEPQQFDHVAFEGPRVLFVRLDERHGHTPPGETLLALGFRHSHINPRFLRADGNGLPATLKPCDKAYLRTPASRAAQLLTSLSHAHRQAATVKLCVLVAPNPERMIPGTGGNAGFSVLRKVSQPPQ